MPSRVKLLNPRQREQRSWNLLNVLADFFLEIAQFSCIHHASHILPKVWLVFGDWCWASFDGRGPEVSHAAGAGSMGEWRTRAPTHLN